MSLLTVRDLGVSYPARGGGGRGAVSAVSGVSFELEAGRMLGIVGESGSGKSQTALAITGLLPVGARIEGSAKLDDEELLGLPRSRLDELRGARVGIVFQDPMSSLNPYRRVGDQMAETLRHHLGASRAAALAESVRMLDAVGIAGAKARSRQYPHEFSGGMRQRVTIAMALLCTPSLLIADEPTTALDVTVQAQVLALLADLSTRLNLAVILITHDLGVVAESCDQTAVMYAGRIVEHGETASLLAEPLHPYTRALLASRPRLDQARPTRLPVIVGQPPDPAQLPAGCAFHPRCPERLAVCGVERPASRSSGARRCACHLIGPGV